MNVKGIASRLIYEPHRWIGRQCSASQTKEHGMNQNVQCRATAQTAKTVETRQTRAILLRRVVAGVAVSAVGVAALVVGAQSAAAAGTFTTTGSVNVRSGPGTNYGIVAGEPSGANFSLICQWQNGTSVGGNATWDRVQFGNGVTGAISDYWTTTPSWNSFAPGTGDCNATPPAAPAPPPPPPPPSNSIGGVNMQVACDTQYAGQGRAAVVLDQHNAYSWACSSPSGTTGINVNQACSTQYGYGATSGLANASNPYTWFCRWSITRARGTTRSYNGGYAGQCTFGAHAKFHDATGVYGAWSGNAWQWSASARNNGWTVVNDAQARAIVVFQPGVQGASKWGHVAWVDSVEQRSDGLYIHITEMNWRGLGVWSTRVVKDIAGTSYILAP